MKRSRGYASPSIIYMYIKFEYIPADRKNERGELSTALLDSNVSHKLYKNEHSEELGETKYFGRYGEEAFNETLIHYTVSHLPRNPFLSCSGFKSLRKLSSLRSANFLVSCVSSLL